MLIATLLSVIVPVVGNPLGIQLLENISLAGCHLYGARRGKHGSRLLWGRCSLRFWCIITTRLVRNLPALLELALLQHLDLTHGTGYAITTITNIC